MVLLKALEWAFGAFLVVFVVWQIAVPLLMGYPAFSLFREKRQKPKLIGEKDKDESAE